MHGISFLRPRANILQPMRGRTCWSMGTSVRNPRRRIAIPPRCKVHSRRRSASKVHPRKAPRVICRCATAREPDSEADLLQL
jgi:hypothetical protein